MGNLVLVIEDSQTIRKIIEISLSREGYSFISFSTGEDAIAWFNSSSGCIPHLVLTDLGLPNKMDGYAVISSLRSHPSFNQIPFVVITSRNKIIDKVRCRLLGVSAYIIKPFKIDNLISVVTRYLGTPSQQ